MYTCPFSYLTRLFLPKFSQSTLNFDEEVYHTEKPYQFKRLLKLNTFQYTRRRMLSGDRGDRGQYRRLKMCIEM